MKSYKFIAAIMLVVAATMAVSATAKDKKAARMYVFGVATSFNDSTAYFTTIQEIDSVTTSGKTGMLANKQEYSYQLKNHFSNKGLTYRTCTTINNKDKKKIQKLYAKTKQKLAKKNKYIIKDIDEREFRFERITMAQ